MVRDNRSIPGGALYMLSRLKGIETMRVVKLKVKLLKVFVYAFPFEGN